MITSAIPAPNSLLIRLLLVEDDHIDRLAFTRSVKQAELPYDYTIAHSLTEAISILNMQSFEIAILDYNLGDGLSSELFPILKDKNCPFIISTGSGDEETAANLMGQGAADYLIKDPDRNYLKILPTTVNKTLARHRSEEQLRLLNHAMQSVKDSIYIVDAEGRLLFTNESLRHLCQLDSANVIGQPIQVLGQPQLTQHLHLDDPCAGANCALDVEICLHRADGHPVPMLLSESLIQDGSHRIRVGLMRDITPLKQVELELRHAQDNLEQIVQERTAQLQGAISALQESEQRFASLAAAAPVGIFRTDRSGNCVYVNQRWCQIAELSLEQALGKRWVKSLHSDDREAIAAEWYQATQENRPFKLEYRFQRTDGSVTWVFGQAVAEYDAEGNIISYVGTITDISDRKQAEADLHQLNQTLEARVEARTQELQEREMQLRDLFDNATDLIQSIAPDGRLIFVNTAWKETLGYDDADLEQLSIFQIIHPDELAHCQTAMQSLFQGASCLGIETRFLTKFGQEIAVEGNVNCQFKDGVPIATRGIFRDITQRKQAENALRESQQFLQTVLDTFPLSVFWKDRNSLYLGCNQNFLHDAGFTSSTELIGKTDYEMPWGETEAANYQADDQRVMGSGTAKLGIVESQHTARGEMIWLETNKLPLRNLRGEVIGVFGTYQNITDRKVAEAALAASELFNRQLVEEFPIGLASCHMDGQLVYVNSAFAKILGRTVEETLSLTYWDITPIKYAEQEAEQLQSIHQHGRYGPYEKEYIHKDGHLVPVLLTGLVIRQNGEELIWSSVQDITERKRTEETLKQQLAAIEAAIDGIAILQQDKYLYLNQAHLELFGYESAEELVGKTWKSLYSAEELERFEREVFPVLGHNRSWQGEAIATRKDGSTFAEGLSLTLTEEGLLICVCRDISEKVRLEAERRQAEVQLQHTNQELARATRLKDEFLANMSHELRTPLNAILGMTEGLQEEVFGTINERQLKALKTVERSGSHLLELINDILDVAKIESGQIELDCAPTAVAPLCHSSLAFIKQQAMQKRIQLETKLSLDLPNLEIDERRIRQVLINLLNNAVKFTPEGGRITLEGRSEENPDKVGSGSWLRLAVIDTGIGIAPENISKLFQPFIQIDSALNRQYQGTGLGLSLVKRIVELHGGRVELTSELGLGSCFAIYLPCSPGSPLVSEMTVNDQQLIPLAEDASLAQPIASQSPLILLAEDNETNINMLSAYLENKGYRLLVAKDGQEAIDFTKAHRPSLILMDIQMPKVDGLEATQQIRQDPDPDLASTPIIALTALAMPGDSDRCLEAGANDYLSKPVKLKQLDALIQQLLAAQENKK